jgi:superfamily II DNA or RNA helicase
VKGNFSETLTERMLMDMGGWQVFRDARALRDSGWVCEVTFAGGVLKGTVTEGGRRMTAGLRFHSATDVDNLCGCRDSRVRALICAHSVGVGLAWIRQPPAKAQPAVAEADDSREVGKPAAPPGDPSPGGSTDEVPEVHVHLEGSLRHLEAVVEFRYRREGEKNLTAELEALAGLAALGFEDFRGKPALRGEDRIAEFVVGRLGSLRDRWTVTLGGRFSGLSASLVPVRPVFRIGEGGDGWLDFGFHYEAGGEAVLSREDVRKLLASGRRQFPLKSGKLAVLDAEAGADWEEVLHDCDPVQEGGRLRIREMFAGYLRASVAHWGGHPGRPSSPAAEAGQLGPMREILRPYQVVGTLWMLDRARRGLGGLLADEMGLGKTVQTLALVEAMRGPCLVVCPSSLVWNWAREAARFLPALRTVAIDGPNRDKALAAVGDCRLVVTSYALLRRDIEKYGALDFSAVILDEAQHIKNPGSQNARAAWRLRAGARFILTGTPVENSLRDLWSLFEFLAPGYLGTREDFRSRYEEPLGAGAGGSVRLRLRRRVGPFVLRRLKKEILTELPPKIEQVVEVELSDGQKAAYAQLQRAARDQVDALRKSGGGGAARMRALTALLRLRQACCDLRLLGAPDGHSAKLDSLREILQEALDGGHRTLVFSQFTSMLDLIGKALDEDGIRFVRLDGSTKDRQSVVRSFQEGGDVPVFLISLKAGGVGLNLTAADTVIHFDPWWNPAVEDQATDRTHRIGQNRVVTSIKLVCRNTVEERVLGLQTRKRGLLEGVLDEESASARLTAADLAELVGGD